VLDRADTVLSVVVLILAIFMLVRDQPSRWWALVMVVLVLGGTGFRQLVERRRQLLVAGLDA
jgi:hypothetical protein